MNKDNEKAEDERYCGGCRCLLPEDREMFCARCE